MIIFKVYIYIVTYTHTNTCTHPFLGLEQLQRTDGLGRGFTSTAKGLMYSFVYTKYLKTHKSATSGQAKQKKEVQTKHTVQKTNASAVTYNKCEEYNLLYLMVLFIPCYPPYSNDFIGISEGKSYGNRSMKLICSPKRP